MQGRSSRQLNETFEGTDNGMRPAGKPGTMANFAHDEPLCDNTHFYFNGQMTIKPVTQNLRALVHNKILDHFGKELSLTVIQKDQTLSLCNTGSMLDDDGDNMSLTSKQ